MTRSRFVQAAMSGAQSPEASNDDVLLDRRLPAVPSRNTPANDNPGIHSLPPCLAVTDEEVTMLHRYLSREILGLFP